MPDLLAASARTFSVSSESVIIEGMGDSWAGTTGAALCPAVRALQPAEAMDSAMARGTIKIDCRM
jgi:hypothetical protein